MPTNCLSKCSPIVALAFALLLSVATVVISGERTGGRMGGSSKPFGHYTKSRSSVSRPHYQSYHRQYDRMPVRGVNKPVEVKNKDGEVKKVEINLWFSWRTVVISGLGMVLIGIYYMYGHCESCVLMVQVGLSGKANSVQRELNWIARNSSTEDAGGFHRVLLDSATVLINHQDDWISGFSSIEKNATIVESETSFRKLSFEERKKVDEETLVNVDGVKEEKIFRQRVINPDKNYVVVTVLVAARGSHDLPEVKSVNDLKKAIQTLSSFSVNQTMAVEVLWTPQDKDSTMLEDDYLENYHLLRPV